MNGSMTSSLVSLASLMSLDPVEAMALPAVIAVAAQKISMTESDLLFKCQSYPEVRNYLKTVIQTLDQDELTKIYMDRQKG